jgi:hypothetical protein
MAVACGTRSSKKWVHEVLLGVLVEIARRRSMRTETAQDLSHIYLDTTKKTVHTVIVNMNCMNIKIVYLVFWTSGSMFSTMAFPVLPPVFQMGATTFPAPAVTTPTMIAPSSRSSGSRFRSLPHLHGHFQDEGIHEETDEELVDSEIAAAVDAHDCPDAGMEAAAQERAVMMAHEMIHQMKMKRSTHLATDSDQDSHLDAIPTTETNSWNHLHLAHDLSEVHLETDQEVLDSEIDAAFDAHDCPDAGMEAAAEERAVMLAQDYIQSRKNKQQT